MTVMKIKRFFSKLSNLKHNFLTKTWLFLFICIVLICYMFHRHNLSNYHEGIRNQSKNENLVIGINQRSSSNSTLDGFNVQPENMEFLLPTRLTTIPRDAVWQTVSLKKEKFFIYSAYLDTRKGSLGPVIRIIASAKTDSPTDVWCRLWYSNSSKTVAAFTYAVYEHNGKFPYSPSFVLCKLPIKGNIGDYPLSVSVVSDIQDPITNEVLIHLPNKTKEFKTDIEVCVQPFHSQYDQGSRIVEFIELYHLLGVKHFTFYNFSVSPKIQCVLDRYKDDNLISVLPWNLDMISDVEIKTEGTNAAFNDCLYRHMYTSKYIAIVDVDEMIIPRSNLTLIQLMKKLHSLYLKTPKVYSFSFRNAFFCMEWADDELSPFNLNQTDTNIIILRKTRRTKLIFPHPNRAKYICNPRHVIEAGNHMVSEFVDEGIDKTVVTPTEIAFLHHYRHCSNVPIYCDDVRINCFEKIVVDRSIYSYKSEIVKKISIARKKLNESCVLS